MSQIICIVCGSSFEGRIDAKTCSDKCRQASRRNVTLKTLKAPSGRIRSVCCICEECKYPNWKGELMYPEDDKGVPYCNSEGPLSETTREILSPKNTDLKSKHAAQTGPYA